MNRLMQSTPLRLTLALVALYAVVGLATLAVAYVIAKNSIETAIRDSLARDVAVFSAAPTAIALSQMVEAQGRVMDPSERIVGFRDVFGRVHGNGFIVRTREGFEAVALNREEEVARTYFALTRALHGGYLTLAVSRDNLADLRATMLTVLLASLLPSAAIALGGGLLIARRSAMQLDDLEATLARLTSGDLSARVSEKGRKADDLARIGRRIDRMAAAQEEKVAALRQVSSDIAHDLKTPIQRLSVLLEQARAADGAAAQALIDRARAETAGIVETFQALLQIARLEGGADRSGFGVVDLGRLAQDMGELYGPSAAEGGRSLAVEVADPARVRGDRTLLGQMLANLIENALRHAGEGADITVTVDGPRLVVADAGPGIPEEERDLVLRRLYRREASRNTPGSGLGLALVKAVADLHGARLELSDNAPGLAVTVTFDQAAAPTTHQPDEPPKAHDSNPGSARPRA